MPACKVPSCSDLQHRYHPRKARFSMSQTSTLQALLDEQRRSAAALGLVFRPRSLEVCNAAGLAEEEADMALADAARDALGMSSKHCTATRAMYLVTKHGHEGVLQVHKAM